MPQLTANGLTLEYDERGEGQPLLLIMGLGAQMIAWHDLPRPRRAEITTAIAHNATRTAPSLLATSVTP